MHVGAPGAGECAGRPTDRRATDRADDAIAQLSRNTTSSSSKAAAREAGWLGAGCTAYVALRVASRRVAALSLLFSLFLVRLRRGAHEHRRAQLNAAAPGAIAGSLALKTPRESTLLVVRADVVSGRLELELGANASAAPERTGDADRGCVSGTRTRARRRAAAVTPPSAGRFASRPTRAPNCCCTRRLIGTLSCAACTAPTRALS